MTFPVFDPFDWESIRKHFEPLAAEPVDARTVADWLRRWSEIKAVLYETHAQVNRKVAEDTTDEEAERQFLKLVEEIEPKASIAEQALRDKLLAVEGWQPAPDQVELLRRLRAESEIFAEANVPLLSELAVLENRYDKIAGGLSIEWYGASETLSQARLHLDSANRAEREDAWRRMMAAYGAERGRLNELYIEMLGLRRRVARNAGFADFRAYKWLELARFDYTPADCTRFHDAIEYAVVPLARRLYSERQGRLGVERLRPWDLDIDLHGEPLRPFTDVAELEAGAFRIFQRVDPELASHFAGMHDGYLDLASRPNKAQGGFCDQFPVEGKPYIFMNAVGVHDDVVTLLHEGGHAFHYTDSRSQPLVWNLNGPMEFCEVASMAMEMLAIPYLERSEGGFYTATEARRVYAAKMEEVVTFLPYMAVVDAFQHWVYTQAPENVTAAELDKAWESQWDRYMVGIDYEGLRDVKASGWHRKLHIFTTPFYYVEYGLAQLGALQVWRNSLSDPAAAVRAYREALSLGYTRPLPDLFRAAGAEFGFDRDTVASLMQAVSDQMDRLSA